MSIRYRPYNVPSKVTEIQNRLNHFYDQGIEAYHHSISVAPLRQPALHISVTNRCNLSCTYCYDKRSQPPFRPPIDMDVSLATAIFERYANPSFVFILGGEPFLNVPVVEAIMDHCPSRISISTNGQVMSNHVDQLLSKIAQRNQDGHATLLQVSCELGGVTQERHTTNAETYITHFAQVCGRYMKVKYTMSKPDVTEISNIAQWYWSRNLLVQFDYADGGYGTGYSVDLSDEDRNTVFDFVLSSLRQSFSDWLNDKSTSWPILRAKTLVNHAFPTLLWQIKKQRPIWTMCGILGYALYIGPEGKIFPCHRWKYSRQAHGVIHERIRNKVAQFHQEVSPRIRDYCCDCIWRGCCGGICPAVVYTFGDKSLEGRCKFIGALRDAVLSFLVDDEISLHPEIDNYLDEVIKFSPFYEINS